MKTKQNKKQEKKKEVNKRKQSKAKPIYQDKSKSKRQTTESCLGKEHHGLGFGDPKIAGSETEAGLSTSIFPLIPSFLPSFQFP